MNEEDLKLIGALLLGAIREQKAQKAQLVAKVEDLMRRVAELEVEKARLSLRRCGE